MPSNTTSRGTLNEERKSSNRKTQRPPLFVSDEKGTEHDAMYAKGEDAAEESVDKPRIPYVFRIIIPLAICVGVALVASVYRIQWLLMVACVVAGISIIVYFISSRRRARYRTLSDKAHMEAQIADYRRDLLKTLEGYDVDRGMTNAEIEALVDEYRHHLEVENASLANVSIMGAFLALIRRNKGGDEGAGDAKASKKAKKAKKKPSRRKKETEKTERGDLADEG